MQVHVVFKPINIITDVIVGQQNDVIDNVRVFYLCNAMMMQLTSLGFTFHRYKQRKTATQHGILHKH